MKTLIQIVLVALTFGGLSAGGSFYFHQQIAVKVAAALEAKEAADKKAAEEKSLEAAKTAASELSPAVDDISIKEEPVEDDTDLNRESDTLLAQPEPAAPPASVRPPWDENGDEAGDLINKLRARARSTSRQEQRMMEREQMMNLIVNDMRFEQTKSARMRLRLLNEAKLSVRAIDTVKQATDSERTKLLEAQNEARRKDEERIENLRREKEESIKSAEDALRKTREELEALRKKVDESPESSESVDRSGTPEETENLKAAVAAMESMPAEDTAKILKKFVEKGSTAAAVAVLNSMEPRKRAKALSAITETNSDLGADLAERLKKLKTRPTQPSKPTN